MPPALVPLNDDRMQAKFVVQRIRDLIEEGTDPSEIAVLYRAHFHSMELQMELTRGEIPFRITSGIRFSSRPILRTWWHLCVLWSIPGMNFPSAAW